MTPLPPAPPHHTKLELAGSQGAVFDAALATAHEFGLEVKVLERASGFIRFERTALSPSDLDKYCEFPFVFSGRGYLPRTFTQLAGRRASSVDNAMLSLTLLITSMGGSAASLDLRSTWTAHIYYDERDLGSHSMRLNGGLEIAFLEAVQRNLLRPDSDSGAAEFDARESPE